MEMLPRQLVQQPGVAGVMLPDYSGCQMMTSDGDGDVLKRMLTVACSNKHTGSLYQYLPLPAQTF